MGATSTSSRSPTAARERSTCCTRRSAASGARRTCRTRSGGRASRAGSRCRRRRRRRGGAGDPARSAAARSARASSRGLGELIRAVGQPRELLVCLGGTANVDGGAGLLEVLDELPAPTRVACDVDVAAASTRRGVFAAQKGATPRAGAELEARSSRRRAGGRTRTSPAPARPAASARRSRRSARSSSPGAALVLDLLGFDPAGYDLVVTGRGHRRRDDALGQGAGRGRPRAARRPGVRCVVFGGRVRRAVARASRPSRSRGDPAAGPRGPRRAWVYGLAVSTRRASSSILPCAASSLPTQSL